MTLRPFFPYYGSKFSIGPKYPRPRFSRLYVWAAWHGDNPA